MFSKEELLEKDIPELENIAKNLEVDYKKSDDKEAIIYAILDRQAVNAGISHPMGTTKRKRTRITKKEGLYRSWKRRRKLRPTKKQSAEQHITQFV